MTESPTGASRANRNAAIVVVVLVLALALGAVGMIVVSWRYLGSKARSARAAPVPSATVRTGVVAPNDGAPIASGATPGVARDAVGPASRAEWWRYQQAHAEGPRWTLPPDMDRTRVDPQTLFEPARRLARTLDPHAELTSAFPFSTHMPVRGGTVDMTKPGYLYFTFGYDYRDPAKAPGEDQIAGAIHVKAELGTLTASRSFRWDQRARRSRIRPARSSGRGKPRSRAACPTTPSQFSSTTMAHLSTAAAPSGPSASRGTTSSAARSTPPPAPW